MSQTGGSQGTIAAGLGTGGACHDGRGRQAGEGMVIGAWGNLALGELGARGMGCSAMWCWPRVQAWMLSQWAKWEQELGARLQLDGKTAPGAAGGQGSLGLGRERPAQRGGTGCTRAQPSSRGGRKGPEERVGTQPQETWWGGLSPGREPWPQGSQQPLTPHLYPQALSSAHWGWR